MADKKDDGKTLGRLTKQVNQTLEMSEVLAGRKQPGGTIGKRLKQQQLDELDISKGKVGRSKKFREFDNYLERMESIANPETGVKKVKITRALIQDPKNPNKII